MVEAHKQTVNGPSGCGASLPVSKEGETSESKESTFPLKDYDTLDFKEMLAACPLDGIELTRVRDFHIHLNI